MAGHIGETRSDWGPGPETATAASDAFQPATIEVITDTATGILRQAEIFAQGLLRPSSLVQIAVVVVLLIIAEVLRRLIKPRMQAWVRGKQGIPKWQLRWFLVIQNRLRGIMFVPLAYGAVAIMQDLYRFPSKYYCWLLLPTLPRLG